MKFNITDIKKPLLIDLYQNMLKSRMIEEKMITLLRQGKIKFHRDQSILLLPIESRYSLHLLKCLLPNQ